MSAVDQMFSELRASGRKALIPFITAGDPVTFLRTVVMPALAGNVSTVGSAPSSSTSLRAAPKALLSVARMAWRSVSRPSDSLSWLRSRGSAANTPEASLAARASLSGMAMSQKATCAPSSSIGWARR